MTAENKKAGIVIRKRLLIRLLHAKIDEYSFLCPSYQKSYWLGGAGVLPDRYTSLYGALEPENERHPENNSW